MADIIADGDGKLFDKFLKIIMMKNSLMSKFEQNWIDEITRNVTEKITDEVTEKITEEVTEKITNEVTEKITEEVTDQNTKFIAKNLKEVLSDDVISECTGLDIDTVKML